MSDQTCSHSPSFAAESNAGDDLFREVGRLSPENPFHASEYVQARRSRGDRPLGLLLTCGTSLVAGCPAFLTVGRWDAHLEIESMPPLAVEYHSVFWSGVAQLGGELGVSRIHVGSYGSSGTLPPHLDGEVNRVGRLEHVVDLEGFQESSMAGSHRRSIRKAQKAELEIRILRSSEACEAHAELVAASLARRQDRGQHVEMPSASAERLFRPFVTHGAGELFQACRGTAVLSSVLILSASRGAYYQSAGTTPDGMNCGASHWLVSAVIGALKERGLSTFNLGGAGQDDAGLYRFKTEFGTRPVSTEAVDLVLPTSPLKSVRRLLQKVASLGPRGLPWSN